MKITLITTCTSRKRKPTPLLLQASSLPHGSQDAILHEWCARLLGHSPIARASSMYCGRAFAEAWKAKNEVSANLWIISAGLGLVSEDEEIPSYSLTVAKSDRDSVLRKILDAPFSPSQWWDGLNSSKVTSTPLSRLITSSPDNIFIIALSQTYGEMIQQDLLSLQDRDLQRVRLIGLALQSVMSSRLQCLIMPYDERFDGPGSLNPGTRADFAQRAMAHFVTRIVRDLPDGHPNIHANAVAQFLSQSVPREIPRRKRLSDREIMDIIVKRWNDSAGNSSKMLRIIRDCENVACEQRRFQQLFRLVKEEVTS